MPGLTVEDHPDLTSNVEGGEERGDRQQPIYNREMQAGIQQNFILRPETGKRNNPRKRQCADHIEPESDRHGLAEPAHVAHIAGVKNLMIFIFVMFFMCFNLASTMHSLFEFLFPWLMSLAMPQVMMSTLHAENDRASGEEQQSLEEGMRNEVEHPSHIRAHPHCRDHETQL